MHKFFLVRGSSLLSGGLIILLCWLLAQWTWLAVAPKFKIAQVDAPFSFNSTVVDDIVVARFFGGGADNRSVPEQHSFSVSSNLKLHGVYASMDSLPAFAIISVDGKPDQPFMVGAEVVKELVLKAVFPNFVEMRRKGVLERLDLESKSFGGSGLHADSTEFNLKVNSQGAGTFSFSRKELNDALKNPRQLTKLGSLVLHPQSAGLSVNAAPKGSLADKLGLQQGDLILQVNGQRATSMDMVNRFYQQLNEVGQIRLQYLRNGQVSDIDYIIK